MIRREVDPHASPASPDPMAPPNVPPAARAAGKPFLAVVVLAAGLAAGALCGAEAYWRARGVRPTVPDSPALWALHRSAVGGDPDVVALLGSSRMRAGFDLATFRRRFPGRPVVQLAIGGNNPEPVLADLAADRRFVGSVVVSFREEPTHPDFAGRTREYLAAAETPDGPGARWGLRLGSAVRERAALLSAAVGWRELLVRVRAGRWPGPSRGAQSFDREVTNLFRPGGADRTFDPSRDLAGSGWAATDYRARAHSMLAAARTITSRGGRAAFVRFPTSGWQRDRTDHAFPRDAFWDRFAARAADIPGVVLLHYEDVPTLRGFTLPDDSHLNGPDKPAFTAALLDELERRGAL